MSGQFERAGKKSSGAVLSRAHFLQEQCNRRLHGLSISNRFSIFRVPELMAEVASEKRFGATHGFLRRMFVRRQRLLLLPRIVVVVFSPRPDD